MLDHVSKGKGNEIGLGATMVIVESASKGVRFVGTLSEEIQNFTTYAAVLSDNKVGSASQEFVRYLTTSAAKAICSSAEIA